MTLHRVRQEFPRPRIASERIEAITVLRFDGIGATASGDLFLFGFPIWIYLNNDREGYVMKNAKKFARILRTTRGFQ